MSSAAARPSPEQIGWLQRAIHKALRANAYGEALAQVPFLYFVDANVRSLRQSAARLLALAVNQNGGSLEGTWDALRFWAGRFGRRPMISDHQVTTMLAERKGSVRELEEWFASVLHGLWEACRAAYRSRAFSVLEIDENQRVFQGRGSKAYLSPKEFRKRATTKAGKTATALKPGRSYASTVGHEWLVMSETFYPLKGTIALRSALRDAVSYDKSVEVSAMLDHRERLRFYPEYVMLDAGFCTYSILARLVHFCRRAKNLGGADTQFWMPASKSKSQKKELDLEALSDNALNGVYDVIMREWNKGPQRLTGTGLFFACVERDIRHSGGLTCNLVIFYRIRKQSAKRKPAELVMERDVVISAFFTNAHVTLENAAACSKLYSMRWNAENLYQKLGKILGMLPSKDVHERVLSYGFGLASMSVYALHRIFEHEANRQAPEDENIELTRLRSFFSAARRDLETMLDDRGDAP